jgi:hypothetical protein
MVLGDEPLISELVLLHNSYSQESVSDCARGIGRTDDSTKRFARQRLYPLKFITLGLSSIVCIKEG